MYVALIPKNQSKIDDAVRAITQNPDRSARVVAVLTDYVKKSKQQLARPAELMLSKDLQVKMAHDIELIERFIGDHS